MVTYPSDWMEKPFNDFMKIKRGASPRPIERYLTKSTDGKIHSANTAKAL